MQKCLILPGDDSYSSKKFSPDIIKKPTLGNAALEPNADPFILRQVSQWQKTANLELFLLCYLTDSQ